MNIRYKIIFCCAICVVSSSFSSVLLLIYLFYESIKIHIQIWHRQSKSSILFAHIHWIKKKWSWRKPFNNAFVKEKKKETKGQNNDEHLLQVGRKGGDGNVSLCLCLTLTVVTKTQCLHVGSNHAWPSMKNKNNRAHNRADILSFCSLWLCCLCTQSLMDTEFYLKWQIIITNIFQITFSYFMFASLILDMCGSLNTQKQPQHSTTASFVPDRKNLSCCIISYLSDVVLCKQLGLQLMMTFIMAQLHEKWLIVDD